MSRLTALLDWLDEAAGGLIRLAYLAAGITAVAVYFGAGHLPASVEKALNGGLPWALAFAVETHTYITARRVRAAWQDHQASIRTSDARERANSALVVNVAVLAALLAFSAWNQLGYLAATWAPPDTFLPLPHPVAYLIRALVVPGAFMCAAFLAPLAEPITAQLENEARATLADVFRIARKQRRRLLKEAEAAGRDMTSALVELVPDPDARRIIAHAYGAIRGEPLSNVADSSILPAAQLNARGVHERPPTGPGSPTVQRRPKRRRVQTPRGGKRSTVLRLTAEGEYDAERRVRAVLTEMPGATIKQIAERASVSSATASKWARVFRAEQEQREQQAAQ